MRKTSHDGVDVTSITSGLENEIKTGIIKMKKSSIKRKVPNFSHESDDGIVEPLLQTDREKTDIASRSAKYLLTKVKTDSISENEDSIKATEVNKTNFTASTPVTTTNKTFTSNNSNNIKDSNYISNTTEVAPIHNHMNTNVFGGSDASKVIISTKSPILVELDVGKTGYNPSLIFTTAKIHTDCKTKLMEPVQVTPVPIISTIEISAAISVNSANTESKKIYTSGMNSDVINNSFEKSNENNVQLSADLKSTPEINIRNNSTSKDILNPKEISMPSEKNLYSLPKNSVAKSVVENNDLTKYDTKENNFTVSLRNDKYISKDIKTDRILETNKSQILPEPSKSKENMALEQFSTIKQSFPDNIIKSEKNQPIIDRADKKITVQGSKKLQRQKKATVEESHENTSKDKISSDAKKTSSIALYTPTKSSTQSSATTTSECLMLTTFSLNTQVACSMNNNMKCISQPQVNSKIPTQVALQPKVGDNKTQPSTSKISTPITPTSKTITTSLIPTSLSHKTTQGSEIIKPTTLNKTHEKQNPTNINKSPQSIKPAIKEVVPVTIEKSSPAPKTLPPYIVSTSKTKIGVPNVTSVTLKSEPIKSTADSKNVPSTNYIVKTTPSSSLKTTSMTVPITSSSSGNKQSVSDKQIKLKTDKQNEDSRA